MVNQNLLADFVKVNSSWPKITKITIFKVTFHIKKVGMFKTHIQFPKIYSKGRLATIIVKIIIKQTLFRSPTQQIFQIHARSCIDDTFTKYTKSRHFPKRSRFVWQPAVVSSSGLQEERPFSSPPRAPEQNPNSRSGKHRIMFKSNYQLRHWFGFSLATSLKRAQMVGALKRCFDESAFNVEWFDRFIIQQKAIEFWIMYDYQVSFPIFENITRF